MMDQFVVRNNVVSIAFEVEMAHRLWKQDLTCERGSEFLTDEEKTCVTNKCRAIHGHSYKFVFYFEAENLTNQGMVIDFYHIKHILQELMDQLDHSLVIDYNDPLFPEIKRLVELFPELRVYVVPFHPTSENLAKYLLEYVNNKLREKLTDIYCVMVEVFETKNASAIAQLVKKT